MNLLKNRAAGYIRVSDESQVDGHSLEAQRREIVRYSDVHGCNLLRIYADEGVSAYTDRIDTRPQFAQLLNDAESGMYDLVIVHTLDRWARRSAVQTQTLERLGKAHVGFVSITENIDYTTPHGKLVLNFLGATSEFSSAQLGVHVSKAQRQRAELGLPVGDIPFGYVRSNPRQAPEVVPAEAQAVRQAFDLRVQGESHGAIAAWFNDRGFQTHTGRLFTEYAIRDMLTNRFYVGVVPYREEEYLGKHQAIIPEELYQQVQLRRAKHGRKNTRGGITGALQGMLSCSWCGNSIHSERNYHGDPRYRERHGWPCPTNGCSVTAHRVDPQIGEIVGSIQLAPEWREQMLRIATAGGSGVDLSSLKKQRQRIARAYGDGAYTDEEYERRLDEVDAKIQSAIPVTLPSIEEAAELLDNLPGLWREALPDERRRLMAPLVDRVYLDLNTKTIAGIRPKPGFGELLAHAIKRSIQSTCVLLSQEEVRELQNVGMVETGEALPPSTPNLSCYHPSPCTSLVECLHCSLGCLAA